MKRPDTADSIAEFEAALAGNARDEHLGLRLYISGSTPKSLRAVRNIRAICEEHLPGRYQLEVIDLHQNPEMARLAQIVLTPTLVKYLPLPQRRVIGDLSDTPRVLAGLGSGTHVSPASTPASGRAVLPGERNVA